MKLLVQAGLCCLLATGLFAQHRGGGGGFHGGGHSVGGFSRAGHVGGGYVRGGGYGGARFAYYGPRGRFGYYSRRGYYWSYPFYGYGFGYPSAWWSPSYGYDSGYVYDYGADSSAYGYSQNPNVTVVYPQQPAASSVIIVPAAPPPPAPAPQEPANSGAFSEIRDQSPLYLIAFQSHVIRAALAYWTEDDRLHYIDLDHKVQAAPLSSVDRSLSDQLNRERRVPFHLPG